MKKKALGIFVCILFLGAAILPVEGTIKETINEESKVTSNKIFEEQIENDFIIPSGKEKIPIDLNFNELNLIPAYGRQSRGSSDYEFIKEPTKIMTSYYDYMPGSYASHPIRIQTDHGDGHYLTFFGQESNFATRRQYWGYIDSNCNVQDWGLITSYDTRQGYGSIGIHPGTGNCIASWHENQDGGLYETALTYDDFDAGETPGFWEDPMTILAGPNDLEYIWPYIYVGPSPSGAGFVRIYQVANDYTSAPAGPVEDVRIMYIDVQDANGIDLSGLLNSGNWNNVTVMTGWRDKSCRPTQAFAIDYNNPGKVGFIGYASWLEGDLGNMPVEEGAFVWESYDYGVTWDPANLHDDGPGTTIYQVENIPEFPGAPAVLNVTIRGGHNTALYDSEGNLHCAYLQQYGYTDSSGSYFFPYFMPQAEMVWNSSSSAFTFHEVPELPGIDPLSGHSVPWDENNNYTTIGWSTYPSAGASAIFHENMQKQAINLEKNWLAQIWVDGTYHQLGVDGDPNYLEYENHPLIYISISIDNGSTWFDPIILTDIFSDKFDFSDQITVYPYVCDQIIDIGDDWGQIFMYYMDDTEFGSKVHGTGVNGSGNINYTSIKIKFSAPPPTPPEISGPPSGKVGEEYCWEFHSSNPSGNLIYYIINWSDGTINETDCVQPCTPIEVCHTYSNPGQYIIKAKAVECPPGTLESDWAEFAVTMPRDKAINTPFLNFLQNHPNLFLLLQRLLQRLGLQ
jgi:hypothetical protein